MLGIKFQMCFERVIDFLAEQYTYLLEQNGLGENIVIISHQCQFVYLEKLWPDFQS